MSGYGDYASYAYLNQAQWEAPGSRTNMYDEFNRAADPAPIVAPFGITLLGAHRHLRVQFLYNTHSNSVVSTKAEKASLNYILRTRFGEDAIGVACAGRVFYDEEELIRSGLCTPGARLFVLYDEESPQYAGSNQDARVLQHDDGRLMTLPKESGTDGGSIGTRRTGRIEGFTYHESIPTRNKTINLRFADGSTKPLLLTNKSVEQFDQVLHALTLHAGDRWVGVKVGEKEYVNDDVLFDSALVEGETYPVTYRQPTSMSIIAKALDKKRNVVYTQLPASS